MSNTILEKIETLVLALEAGSQDCCPVEGKKLSWPLGDPSTRRNGVRKILSLVFLLSNKHNVRPAVQN